METGRIPLNMKLGIGIVGSGAIAKVHAACIHAQPNTYLAGILTRNQKNAASIGAEFDTVVFTNPKEFYKQADLDIVCICNESGRHGESITEAIQANKHILCEKPLETSGSKIDLIFDQLKKTSLKLGVVFQNRLNPAYKEFKSAIQSGKLGTILLVNTQINWYRDANYYQSNAWRGTLKLDGGAALINQGIHTLDLLLDLMGDVDQVGAKIDTKVHDIEGEDLVVAHLTFKKGSLGTLSAGTCLYPGHPESIAVYGTKGSMVFEGGSIQSCSLPDWKSNAKTNSNQGSKTAKVNSIELHQAVLNDFIHAVLEDRQPLVNIDTARKSVELIQTIYQASNTNQIIKLEQS